MKASLKNHRQAPRKMRLVANLIRGKSVAQARAALAFLPKKAAPAIGKLIDSAVTNAEQAGKGAENLTIKTITVNKGQVLKRFRPFKQGRAGRLHKEMSHVQIELGEK